jgi:hypothetical protein
LIPSSIPRVIIVVTGLIAQAASRAAPRGLADRDRDKPASAGLERDDVERPDRVPRLRRRLLTQHDDPAGIHPSDRQCQALPQPQPALPDQADLIAGAEVLPFFPDPVRVVNAQAEEVLQPVVAVHTAAILADLDEPLPHVLWRGVHGGGQGVTVAGPGISSSPGSALACSGPVDPQFASWRAAPSQ